MLLALLGCAVFAVSEPRTSAAGTPPQAKTSTRTSAVALDLSAEELELARYLDALTDLDLLAHLEMLELMPILEESE